MADSPLREEVRTRAEDRPGVYRWIGAGGRILYVGKSVRLRSRLLSYFREGAGKAARVVAEAEGVNWDHTPNEFASVVREMRLIRAWRPRYNVRHKRDRRYGFIKITREPAPRLVPVSRARSDGARYYGPVTPTGWLGEAVHALSLATGLRDCPGPTPVHFGDQLEIFAGGRVPRCMRADTGTCLAPCAGRCTTAEYDRRLRLARAFLEGRGRAPLEELARSVEEAAASLRFEYAAALRDRMATLERLWDHLSGFRGRVEKLNLVYPVPGHRGDDRIYLIRRGRPCAEVPWPKSDRARRRANAAVEEVFRPVPGDRDAELEADAAAEVLLTVAWFRQRPRERRRAVAPERWLAGARGATGSEATKTRRVCRGDPRLPGLEVPRSSSKATSAPSEPRASGSVPSFFPSFEVRGGASATNARAAAGGISSPCGRRRFGSPPSGRASPAARGGRHLREQRRNGAEVNRACQNVNCGFHIPRP